MNPRLARAVAVALITATTLGAAATAHAAPGMEVGLQDDAVFLYQSYYNRDTGLQQARQLGVTRLRVNILWSRVASAQASQTTPPAPVIYDWTPYDSLVDAAAAVGIKVQFSIAGPAPAWANAKHLNEHARRRLQAERPVVRSVRARRGQRTSRGASTATRSGTSPTGRAGSRR